MMVSDLIKKLSGMPQQADVVVFEYVKQDAPHDIDVVLPPGNQYAVEQVVLL